MVGRILNYIKVFLDKLRVTIRYLLEAIIVLSAHVPKDTKCDLVSAGGIEIKILINKMRDGVEQPLLLIISDVKYVGV